MTHWVAFHCVHTYITPFLIYFYIFVFSWPYIFLDFFCQRELITDTEKNAALPGREHRRLRSAGASAVASDLRLKNDRLFDLTRCRQSVNWCEVPLANGS